VFPQVLVLLLYASSTALEVDQTTRERDGVVFDPAVNARVDGLHEILTALKDDVQVGFEEINVHTSILNMTSEQSLQNKHSIEELQLAHNRTIDFILALSTDVVGLKIIQKAQGILMHLQLALTSFIEESRIIDRALIDLFNGYVHPYVLSNDAFLKLLRSIETPNHKLLFPVTSENIKQFRDLISVTYRHTKQRGTVYFYLMVPLQSFPPINYNLFSMTTYPITYDYSKINKLNSTERPSKSLFLTLELEHKYFAISNDSKYYMLFKDLNHCLSFNTLYVCPPTSAIYNVELTTCESSIFFRTPEHKDLCNFKIQKKVFPTFTLLGDKWLYHIKPNISLLIRCSSSAHPIDPVVLTNATGMLRLPDTCAASGSNIHLPSSSMTMAKEPELFPHRFNRSTSYLQSSFVLKEATQLFYDDINKSYISSTADNNFKLDSQLLPLIRKMEYIHSKAVNVPVLVDHFMYIVIAAITILFLLHLRYLRDCRRRCCGPVCTYSIQQHIPEQADAEDDVSPHDDAVVRLKRIASSSHQSLPSIAEGLNEHDSP